jgi:hypothetical protein
VRNHEITARASTRGASAMARYAVAILVIERAVNVLGATT